jgi:hypothetical protein
MDFGLNPNQATIFPKKRNHCLRNNIIQKYAILNIVIYNILSQNQKGGSGALGIQQPYPLPPNDKMNKK